MANIFDEAMATVGGVGFIFQALAACTVEVKTPDSIEDAITIEDFVRHALRPINGVKSVQLVVELVRDIPEEPLGELATRFSSASWAALPEALRWTVEALPEGAKAGLVIRNNDDGTLTALRLVMFASPIPAKNATALSKGELLVPVFRQGPWAVKKAFHSLLARIPGHHVLLATVHKKELRVQQVEMPDEIIDEGVDFIMAECPTDDADGATSKWIWKNMKPSSGSKIAGWPENRIRRIADNKRKAAESAQVERFFPLTLMDTKPIFWQVLFPLMVPLLLSASVLLLGRPGVGKTPWFCSLAMAFGRFRQRGGGGAPGWRRGKSWDDFRDRVSEVSVAAFVDDPTLPSLDIADIKNFLTGDSNGTAHARYADPRFVKNMLRGIADNECDDNSEPPEDNRTSIMADEFIKMMAAPFGHCSKLHLFAVLGRVVTIYAGRHAMYVRFPDKQQDAEVHRITLDDVAADWFADPGNKAFYGKYKTGLRELPPSFDDSVAAEQRMLNDSISTKGDTLDKDWVKKCNTKLQTHLRTYQSKIFDAASPVRPEDDGDALSQDDFVVKPDSAGHYHIPIPRIGAPGGAVARRIRGKRKVADLDDSQASVRFENGC